MAIAIGVLFILIGLGIRDVTNRIRTWPAAPRDRLSRPAHPPSFPAAGGPGAASMAWSLGDPEAVTDQPPTS
jgi:hypothetical protein